jgi:RNase P subunit RPR2
MGERDSYQEFEAAELFCSNCKKLVPVRKKMLLILSEGDKYDYVCAECGERVGGKMDKKEGNLGKLIV